MDLLATNNAFLAFPSDSVKKLFLNVQELFFFILSSLTLFNFKEDIKTLWLKFKHKVHRYMELDEV